MKQEIALRIPLLKTKTKDRVKVFSIENILQFCVVCQMMAMSKQMQVQTHREFLLRNGRGKA